MSALVLRLRAATALDRSLNAASLQVGAYTPKIRATLALWLDGRAPKLRVSTVRKCCAYLEMIAR